MARISIPPGGRIRALVVDDSVVIRRLVTMSLQEDPAIEVVGTASDGALALERVKQLNPDVVTLDIEMPGMNGIETLCHLRKLYPHLVVIMFSTLTSRGASATMEALLQGANDYVTKAANVGSLDRSIQVLRGELIPKIRQFFTVDLPAPASSPPEPWNGTRPATAAAPAAAPNPVKHLGMRHAVVLGVSTGGPTALADIFPQFPEDLGVPLFVVQHMPPMFTRLLAERLQAKSKIKVVEAEHGMAARPATAYVAPGDFHLQLQREGPRVICTLNQDPPENSCRPAVDVLFRSAAQVYRGGVVAAILTGMGQDGLRGVEVLRPIGAYVIAQDEASSVVWGMPGAVARAGLADSIVSLESVVPEILKNLKSV